MADGEINRNGATIRIDDDGGVQVEPAEGQEVEYTGPDRGTDAIRDSINTGGVDIDEFSQGYDFVFYLEDDADTISAVNRHGVVEYGGDSDENVSDASDFGDVIESVVNGHNRRPGVLVGSAHDDSFGSFEFGSTATFNRVFSLHGVGRGTTDITASSAIDGQPAMEFKQADIDDIDEFILSLSQMDFRGGGGISSWIDADAVSELVIHHVEFRSTGGYAIDVDFAESQTANWNELDHVWCLATDDGIRIQNAEDLRITAMRNRDKLELIGCENVLINNSEIDVCELTDCEEVRIGGSNEFETRLELSDCSDVSTAESLNYSNIEASGTTWEDETYPVGNESLWQNAVNNAPAGATIKLRGRGVGGRTITGTYTIDTPLHIVGPYSASEGSGERQFAGVDLTCTEEVVIERCSFDNASTITFEFWQSGLKNCHTDGDVSITLTGDVQGQHVLDSNLNGASISVESDWARINDNYRPDVTVDENAESPSITGNTRSTISDPGDNAETAGNT